MRRQAGVSLVEALIVVVVVAVLGSLAVPRFADLAARQRLRGAGDNLRSDLHFARSEAIKQGSHVYVVFSAGTSWCYAVTVDATCGCGIACASPDSLLKQVLSSDAANGVEMSPLSIAGSFCGARKCIRFDPMHGNALGSNGTVTFASGGAQYKVIVASLGRVRMCRVGDGAGGAPGC